MSDADFKAECIRLALIAAPKNSNADDIRHLASTLERLINKYLDD